MGYEVDEATLDAYAQHLLNTLVDTKEERFKTCKEKSMELHSKFIKLARKRKVTKIVEDILVEEGYPREKFRATRVVRDAVEKRKKQKTAPAPVKVKAPKKGEFGRVIRKSQSGGEKKREKEKKAKSDPTRRPTRGRRVKIQPESSDKKRGGKERDKRNMEKIILNDPLYKDALKPSQSENPRAYDVNKEEDTQDVAEQ
ncbi:uncharacterized protein LOC131875790 [Cryptomeria japonica]|uniref:uncharacterized protein LOC131875790 n=1 Tax=Cryptomeria japonica TaxID=3369 RepID=UPI0027DA22B9|nr:uncharacterized protein LOC131875790 [Cryptomeria japonica]